MRDKAGCNGEVPGAGTGAGVIWRTFCGLRLAEAGGVNLQDMLENGWGQKGLWRLLVFTRSDFLIQKQNFSQEIAGICKTAGTDLHLGVIAKGYGFRLKGINIFRRQSRN